MPNDISYINSPERRTKERRKGVETEVQKTIIFDTNVFMRYGESVIFQYKKHNIVIDESVREELNHQKIEKGENGELPRRLRNCRSVISFFDAVTEKYSPDEIKNGIPISSLTELVFGDFRKVPSTGRLFLQMSKRRNDIALFSKEFKTSEIVSITVRNKNNEDLTVNISKEVESRIKRALWDIQDREILATAIRFQKTGDVVLLVTEDENLRTEARLKGIPSQKHEHNDQIFSTKNATRKNPGRIRHQRDKDWN